MQSESTIAADTCAEIRQQFHRNDGFEPLLKEFDITETELRTHLYGDCGHDIDVPPITPAGLNRVSEEECASMRKKAKETSTADLADSYEYLRQTIARHAFGRCSHEIDTPEANPFEYDSGENLSPDECADLRAAFRESDFDKVQHFSARKDYAYHVILTHLRDRCDHDIDEEPIAGNDRAAAEISQEKCRKMREYWRDNLSATYAGVANEFEVSSQTAERHIKFLCPHEYETVPADELDIFSEALDQ
jgi:5-methylcytosine-specific restriction protein A